MRQVIIFKLGTSNGKIPCDADLEDVFEKNGQYEEPKAVEQISLKYLDF